MLLDKSTTDDKLIATLQEELQKLQCTSKTAKHDADIDTQQIHVSTIITLIIDLPQNRSSRSQDRNKS